MDSREPRLFIGDLLLHRTVVGKGIPGLSFTSRIHLNPMYE